MAVPTQGGLGIKLKDWLKSFNVVTAFNTYKADCWTRVEQIKAWLTSFPDYPFTLRLAMLANILIWIVPYIFFGLAPVNFTVKPVVNEPFYDNPSEEIARIINKYAGDPTVREIAESAGAFITEPFLSVMEGYAGRDDVDPKEVARAFHGTSMSISIIGGLVDTAAQATSLGAIKSMGGMFNSIYWNLGLGFLGWQTLAPLLSAGLQPGLERYYARKFRPARFSAAQCADLFALGELSGNDLAEELRNSGWRDADIAKYQKLAYKKTSESDCWKLYNAGLMSKATVESRLRGLGYEPDDIPLQFKLNDLDQVGDAKGVLISTARNAFKNGLIGESEFRRILLDQQYPAQQVDLEVQLIKLSLDSEKGDLTRSDIHTLYSARTIARVEAVSYLVKAGLDKTIADKLVTAWDDSDAPAPLRINQSTVRAAYVAGVLSVDQARSWLLDLTYPDAQADLLIKTWQAETGSTAKQAGPLGLGKLTLAQLAQFYTLGLLTKDQIAARPELNRYAADDKTLIVELLTTQAASTTQPLSVSVITNAYRYGLISREELVRRLELLGSSADDAELQAQVIDADIAEESETGGAATIKTPSVGSLQLAVQRGLISADDFVSRLMGLGFDAEAANLYLLNAQYQSPAKEAQLSKTDVLAMYKSGELTRSEVQYRLIVLGYNVEDAQLLIRHQSLTPEDTEIGQAWLLNLIDTTSATTWFTDYGFSADEIAAFFAAYQ